MDARRNKFSVAADAKLKQERAKVRTEGFIERLERLAEVAPPGREDQVRELKKSHSKSSAFAIAWASYNKSHGK